MVDSGTGKKIVVAGILAFSAFTSQAQDLQYDLDRPAVRYQLPAILNEVSGLTDIDSAHVACVQDELGIIFVYNFRTGEIVGQQKFSEPGDFEGLTYTGSSLFALRSDGRLTEWSNFKSGSNAGKITHYNLRLPTTNNEGLAYDKLNNRLLIGAKNKPVNKADKDKRYIYSFDLRSKQLMKQPAFTLDVAQLYTSAKRFNISKQAGKGKHFNFRPASLSVHPRNGNIYIISAADQMIVGINTKNEIVYMKRLNPSIFPKAEGITFLNDETMIITNEAAGKTAMLYVYKKKT